MVWVWKISPKNPKFLIFFPSGQKNLIGLGQKVPWSKTGQPIVCSEWTNSQNGWTRQIPIHKIGIWQVGRLG